MSHELYELTDRLIQTLQLQAQRLTELSQALAEHRTSFVALRANDLLEGLDQPSQLVESLQQVEEQRESLNQKIAKVLGLEGTQIRLSRLRAELSSDQAARLDKVGQRLDAAARQVRTETTVGNRLLQLSEQANSGILAALVGPDQQHTTYGKDARSAASPDLSGTLISGTA